MPNHRQAPLRRRVSGLDLGVVESVKGHKNVLLGVLRIAEIHQRGNQYFVRTMQGEELGIGHSRTEGFREPGHALDLVASMIVTQIK